MGQHRCRTLRRAEPVRHFLWRAENWKRLAPVYPAVPADRLEAYVRAVFTAPANIYTPRSYANRDCVGEAVNVVGGLRRTVGAPAEMPRHVPRLLMLGDSRMYGAGVEDADTLPSRLQALLHRAGVPVWVRNWGIRSNTLMNILSQLRSMPPSPRDALALLLTLRANHFPSQKRGTRAGYWSILRTIAEEARARGMRLLVFRYPDIRRLRRPTELESFFQSAISTGKRYSCICPDFAYAPDQPVDAIDTQAALDAVPGGVASFWDFNHTGPAANEAIARFIYPHVARLLASPEARPWGSRPQSDAGRARVEEALRAFRADCKREFAGQLRAQSARGLELYRDCEKFAAPPGARIGAIIMNCNPFTNGHAYLVEQALLSVDSLYVFVLSEDRSLFSFEHRFAMVRDHFAANPRVRVLPSGTLMASSFTFPDYFDREDISVSEVDATLDTAYFSDVIAKIFHISVRIVGTEPNSPVMAHYNAMLKAELPKNGMEVVEIERKTDGQGSAISASRIRECIREGRWESLRGMVPDSTFAIIARHYREGAR